MVLSATGYIPGNTRCTREGSKIEVADFSTFGAKAVAAIGSLARYGPGPRRPGSPTPEAEDREG